VSTSTGEIVPPLGQSPIYEIGLAELIQRNVKLGRLGFSIDLSAAVDRSLVIFLAVGTPEGTGGRPDLSAIYLAAAQIGACMTEYKVIAVKSTVPVGTQKLSGSSPRIEDAGRLRRRLFRIPAREAAINVPPPDRIILSSDSERALAIMRCLPALYLLKNRCYHVQRNRRTDQLRSQHMLALRFVQTR
jgi:UDPglucose 6-dehydrogenase